MEQPERRLADIHGIIDKSELPEAVKEKSKAVFNRLAVAEAAVHDTTPDHIHFHEVGAVDAIVDIVGTVLGLYLLGGPEGLCLTPAHGKGFYQVHARDHSFTGSGHPGNITGYSHLWNGH